MKRLFPLTALLFFCTFISCQKETDAIITEDHHVPVANGGNSQIVQAPANTLTFVGTGSSQNGPIVGYLWSLVNGPNVPLIVSESSPTTAVRNLVPGNYVFQFMVIDSIGLTGIDTVSVVVRPALEQSIVLQPANNPGELVLVFSSPSYSDPNAPEIVAEAWTNGGNPFTCRNLLKFDLAAIPSTATIVSAKLSLFSTPSPVNGNLINANFGANNSLFLERVSTPWTTTVLWPSQPQGDVATQISLPHTNSSMLDIVDLDVKNQVAAMVSSGNYGFKLRLQNETIYTSRIFCSSRFSNAAKHPKLVVVYQ